MSGVNVFKRNRTLLAFVNLGILVNNYWVGRISLSNLSIRLKITKRSTESVNHSFLLATTLVVASQFKFLSMLSVQFCTPTE